MSRISKLALALLLGTCLPAAASPWAEVGDSQLRADIEVLAASGQIDDLTIHWGLPWEAAKTRLGGETVAASLMVQGARRRVLKHARTETDEGFSAALRLAGTGSTSLVHGFNGMARGEGEAQGILEYSSGALSAQLALGAFTANGRGNTTKLMLDESYVAVQLGDALVYGGWRSHWWGPGWISALSLSNFARPMPQVGIQRASTAASSWPILSLLGPWQFEFLLGAFDGPRVMQNQYYNALHFVFNPLPGLQIGLSRTQQFCGTGIDCVPLLDYFSLSNDFTKANRSNDQGSIEVKYRSRLAGVPVEFYLQAMNEDSSPFIHSATSHLFGTSAYFSVSGRPFRITLEYADTVPTRNIFSFGDFLYGYAYTNGQFIDGIRHRGRTLGFGLDSDSRLLSLQAAWSDIGGRFYQLTVHKGQINDRHNIADNIVSTVPVNFVMGEGRVTLPWNGAKLDLAVRLQSDQPRPRKGFEAALEASLRVDLN